MTDWFGSMFDSLLGSNDERNGSKDIPFSIDDDNNSTTYELSSAFESQQDVDVDFTSEDVDADVDWRDEDVFSFALSDGTTDSDTDGNDDFDDDEYDDDENDIDAEQENDDIGAFDADDDIDAGGDDEDCDEDEDNNQETEGLLSTEDDDTESDDPYGEPQFDNFDPETSDDDLVIGNPANSMQGWHVQESNSTCAVAAQEFVLQDLTGIDFEEGDLARYAQERDWYSADHGTSAHDVGNLLLDAGLEVTRSYGNNFDSLRDALQQGDGVIVSVEANRLWYDDDDTDFLPGMGADHAVQVAGIDYSHETPMVILNDSGISDGCGAMVDMDRFVSAWSAGDCYMVNARRA